MSYEAMYLIAAVFAVILVLVAFHGRGNAFPLCICGVLLAWLFVGMAEMDDRGDDAMMAMVFSPLESLLVGVTGFTGDDRSVNPCPPDRNLGQYGSSARYDGILIEGSPEFVSRTITALERLYPTDSYKYAKQLRLIEEARLHRRYAQVSGRHAKIDTNAAKRSCTLLASTIVHEGAHVVYGSGHGPVYAAQARALEEMGEPHAARASMQMARNAR